MVFMRELSDSTKLSFRSAPEVDEMLGVLVARYRARGLTLGGRKLAREHLANALFCWLHAQPAAVQEDVLRTGLAALAGVLGDATPAPAVPPGAHKQVDVTIGGSSRRKGSSRGNAG
jgi:hypothetical protein